MNSDTDHVVGLINQINTVLAGEGWAETATTLTLAVVCHIVATSNSPEERLDQARGFTKQVEDYLRRQDIVEWIKHSTTHIQKSAGNS